MSWEASGLFRCTVRIQRSFRLYSRFRERRKRRPWNGSVLISAETALPPADCTGGRDRRGCLVFLLAPDFLVSPPSQIFTSRLRKDRGDAEAVEKMEGAHR